MRARSLRSTAVVATLLALAGCATLGNLLQPPSISAAQGYGSTIRLLTPSTSHPLGGASLQVYARVQNPNSFGLTLSSVSGNLFLESTRAADVDLPLGLPLRAAQDTVIPIVLTLDFSDLPGLVDVGRRLLVDQQVGYRLEGKVRVDAGPLGQPEFGPSTLLNGQVTVRR